LHADQSLSDKAFTSQEITPLPRGCIEHVRIEIPPYYYSVLRLQFSFWQLVELHFELQAVGVALICEVVHHLGE